MSAGECTIILLQCFPVPLDNAVVLMVGGGSEFCGHSQKGYMDPLHKHTGCISFKISAWGKIRSLAVVGCSALRACAIASVQ